MTAPRASGFLLTPALAGAVLGPVLQLQQPRLSTTAVYAAIGLAGAMLLLAGWRWRRSVLVLVAVAAIAAGATGLRARAFQDTALDPALEGRDLRITGVVAGMPQRTDAGLRFRFDVESAQLGQREVVLPPRVLLGWYGGAETRGDVLELQAAPADLRAGERWQLTARLKAPHGHVNPHGFDYELWLWEQGLQATGYVRAGPRDPPPRRLAALWRHPVEQARQRVREDILARVPDARLAGVLAALVVGDQGAIERVDWDIFRATGVAHLMSISGLHVTMFAWLAAWLVGAAWRRSARLCLAWPAQHAAWLGGVLLAMGYALFAGWGVPAQRTVWMLATVAVLRLAARDWPWPLVWLLACASVVTVDPWALTQAGFWLSFVAVGVLFASGSGPANRLGALLREQVVVTVALTPLSLLLFGQVSVIGLLANLVAIPWVTLVVTPLGMLGVLAPPLWTLAGWCVHGLAFGLQWLAAWPGATWSAPAPPLWAAAAGVAGGLVLVMRLPGSLRVLGLPLLLPVLLWQAPRPAPGTFELLVADVGQGNAVVVRTAAHTLVYDAGPAYSRETDAGQRVLVPLLRAFGEQVDLLVLSHRDQDHTGGAAAVLRMQAQAGLLASLEPAHPLQALRRATRCEAGQAWDWDGVRFELLHPAAGDYAGGLKPNALSCVLRVATPGAAVLLAGDIEARQEAALVAAGAPLRADLLLVPHHGSKTSSTGPFLAAVQPTLAVVQAGYRNRFGHPAPEVVQRLREHSIAVHASAQCGAARWDSRSPAAVRCERVLAPRYWRKPP